MKVVNRVVYDSINSNQFNHDKFGKPIKSIKSEQFSGIDSIDSNATMKGINQLNQTTQTKIYIRFFAPPTWKSVHSSLVYLPTYLPTEETKILSFNPRRTYWFSTYAPAEGGGRVRPPPRRFAPGGASASRKKRACAPLRDAEIGTRF